MVGHAISRLACPLFVLGGCLLVLGQVGLRWCCHRLLMSLEPQGLSGPPSPLQVLPPCAA
ncbi:hypothetical protein E2562_021844 [Oryza meyeriana var. granulata]|uniref:Uncharacterized protein n=1 Tax=Oryza meyeriana var. granulata TaxID=110450 RepID=A0A6G1END9_9ORYZ|nr:hypothetical protein E2562_021844 [Oryza meyeriana var. granulata]